MMRRFSRGRATLSRASSSTCTSSTRPLPSNERRRRFPTSSILESRMAVAIVDTAGDLVYCEKMDATQTGSVGVAIAKARSAARFKRPTKAFQDALAAGGEGLRVLALKGAVPVDGGVPVIVDGKIVGA